MENDLGVTQKVLNDIDITIGKMWRETGRDLRDMPPQHLEAMRLVSQMTTDQQDEALEALRSMIGETTARH